MSLTHRETPQLQPLLGISVVEKQEQKGKRMVVESYVVVHNIAKRHNVGTMARSASAFGVSEVILVGRRDFNAFGSHGSTSHLRFRHFHSLQEARLFLKVWSLSFCYSGFLFFLGFETEFPFLYKSDCVLCFRREIVIYVV